MSGWGMLTEQRTRMHRQPWRDDACNSTGEGRYQWGEEEPSPSHCDHIGPRTVPSGAYQNGIECKPNYVSAECRPQRWGGSRQGSQCDAMPGEAFLSRCSRGVLGRGSEESGSRVITCARPRITCLDHHLSPSVRRSLLLASLS
ncbi:hypothetical protein M430DRAFT_149518 [Amorphotheca resinae ATCC 22711]|uniref:Uncharacterized protein n=1 Tax=Amorphotheca resinae ATCC 22711 TaxID=857342 RepID=A0A2T3BCF7_AMORE|nr:hypothetical protein M430DRAFT_149518 [Amorphotheca resinae ATCC 22711]PSS27075.1 hypothetical protein M430DRAFT_149518 [Amorphotheca resinae ATCC 22711]